MARKLLFKAVAVLLGVTALVVAGIPICLYWFGLSNIEGRPQPPTKTSDLLADIALLQRDIGTRDAIVIEPLNPWTFIGAMFYQTQNLRSEHGRSLRAVGIIVMNYNSSHLRDHRMMWWHLSEMSLTIWLTRHWTTDEIVTAAAALARIHPNPAVRS